MSLKEFRADSLRDKLEQARVVQEAEEIAAKLEETEDKKVVNKKVKK